MTRKQERYAGGKAARTRKICLSSSQPANLHAMLGAKKIWAHSCTQGPSRKRRWYRYDGLQTSPVTRTYFSKMFCVTTDTFPYRHRGRYKMHYRCVV